MTINTLTRFDNNGLELVIDTSTGEAFATQAGYARMSGIDYAAIRKRCERLKGVREESVKTAEVLTVGGSQKVTLITVKLAFKWAIIDNPELAEKMAAYREGVYFQPLANYPVTSDAKPPISKSKKVVVNTPKKEKRSSACLYVIRDKNAHTIKIGVSSNVSQRLRNLQSSNAHQLELLWVSSPKQKAFELEQYLHRQLDDFRLMGEWFDSLAYSLVDWKTL